MEVSNSSDRWRSVCGNLHGVVPLAGAPSGTKERRPGTKANTAPNSGKTSGGVFHVSKRGKSEFMGRLILNVLLQFEARTCEAENVEVNPRRLQHFH